MEKKRIFTTETRRTRRPFFPTESYRWRVLPVTCCLVFLLVLIPSGLAFSPQELLPLPPSDRSLIYFLDGRGKLTPLAFEAGQTPISSDQIAKREKISYIELKGEHAATIVDTAAPRLFLFSYERAGAHPPFLVRLTPKRRARRVTAIAQPGLRGFAIASEEIIMPTIRVLARDGDTVFMELRPRASLLPGEYAIIGADLARIATFRIAEAIVQQREP